MAQIAVTSTVTGSRVCAFRLAATDTATGRRFGSGETAADEPCFVVTTQR